MNFKISLGRAAERPDKGLALPVNSPSKMVTAGPHEKPPRMVRPRPISPWLGAFVFATYAEMTIEAAQPGDSLEVRDELG